MMRECSGELWTINEHAAKVWNVNRVFSEPGGGISKHPNTIREGGNSGYQACGLALLFGVSRIVLLGFDMQFTRGRRHWHPDHERNNPVAKSFHSWRKNFQELAGVSRVPIVNATRETAMTCFRRVTLEDALARGD